jgi:hypothetical protein
VKLVQLPCGAQGYEDGIGVRCTECLTIYGSMACPCTREKKPTKPCNSFVDGNLSNRREARAGGAGGDEYGSQDSADLWEPVHGEANP